MTKNHTPILHLIAIMILAITTTAAASHLKDPPLPNPKDGCSCVPDFKFTSCCDDHDRAYRHGGTWEQRKRADEKFRQCIRNKGYGVLDDIYYLGVRISAVPWLPTPFRWGFGYPFKKGHRGYTPHSEETEKILNE